MPPGVGPQAGVEAILTAAQRNGMTREQTAALLASSFVESGWNPSAVGDGGTSFGLFQQHAGGAGGPTVASAKTYLVASRSASEAAARFKAAGVTTGAGAAASQRPADRAGYAARVDSVRREILAGSNDLLNRLLGSSTTAANLAASTGIARGAASTTPAKPKWSPQRDQVAAKAGQLGLRHTSGDRSPSSNSAAGGVDNSYHLSTRTDGWADDYVGSETAMAQLVSYAKTLPGIAEAMVHDAGSGRHAHIAGKATGGSSSSSSSDAAGDGSLIRTGFGLDDVAGTALKAVVLLVGMALAAGLIYAGVTRLTNTQGVARELGMMAATKGAAK